MGKSALTIGGSFRLVTSPSDIVMDERRDDESVSAADWEELRGRWDDEFESGVKVERIT